MVENETTDFDKFLTYLAPDRDEAAKRYENIRRSLIRYFISRRANDPELCADMVLEVLQRKIAAGEELQNAERYGFAVASKVRFKDWEQGQKMVELTGNLISESAQPSLETIEEENASEKCMTACLKNFPAKDRDLVVQYYLGEKHDKERRGGLAKREGLTAGNLKVKVHRLTKKLKECLAECLKKRERKV